MRQSLYLRSCFNQQNNFNDKTTSIYFFMAEINDNYDNYTDAFSMSDLFVLNNSISTYSCKICIEVNTIRIDN